MISEQALKARLKLISKDKGIPFNLCWKQLLFERFLSRLSFSTHATKLIFKGGFLLSYLMKINRETFDLDFLLTNMKSKKDAIEGICKDIAKVPLNDGFIFNFSSIFLLSQPHMKYPGYRIKFKAAFANMKDQIHIDIGVGDVVEPQPIHVPLFQYRGKPFFEGTLSLLAYPIESIFSEKLETLLSKGSGNSRIKDYHDLLLLIREPSLIDPKKLISTTSNTFRNRNTPLKLISFDEKGIQKLQQLWTAHLLGLGDVAYELNFPNDIEAVIHDINKMLEKFLTNTI